MPALPLLERLAAPEAVEKARKVNVRGYTRRSKSGKLIRVSSYNRDVLSDIIGKLQAGETAELPDGRQVRLNSKGRIELIHPDTNKGPERKRQGAYHTPGSAAERIREKSARSTREGAFGGAQKHRDAAAAEREDERAGRDYGSDKKPKSPAQQRKDNDRKSGKTGADTGKLVEELKEKGLNKRTMDKLVAVTGKNERDLLRGFHRDGTFSYSAIDKYMAKRLKAGNRSKKRAKQGMSEEFAAYPFGRKVSKALAPTIEDHLVKQMYDDCPECKGEGCEPCGDSGKVRRKVRKAEQFTKPGTANVSASDLAKLRPLLEHYRKQARPFTSCKRDQIKHGLSEDHANRRCAVIKDLIEGGTGWRGRDKVVKASGAWTADVAETLDRVAKSLAIVDEPGDDDPRPTGVFGSLIGSDLEG